MEYLQYNDFERYRAILKRVLNLIINGIPSIPTNRRNVLESTVGFKPYYKWNTFNTGTETMVRFAT